MALARARARIAERKAAEDSPRPHQPNTHSGASGAQYSEVVHTTPAPLPSASKFPVAPSLVHFHYTDFHDVYEPADDTFLFLDALRSDFTPFLAPRLPRVCLELGCGSGTLVTYLAMLLRDGGWGTKPAAKFSSFIWHIARLE